MRAKIPATRRGLQWSLRAPRHGVLPSIEHIDFLWIADRHAQCPDITERVCPFDAAFTLLCSIPGVSQRTAEVTIAEMGVDTTKRFATAGHCVPGPGCATGESRVGGETSSGGHAPGFDLATDCARRSRAASRSKGTYFYAQYSFDSAKRRGSNKATVAVAHSILDVAWHLPPTAPSYNHPGSTILRVPSRSRS